MCKCYAKQQPIIFRLLLLFKALFLLLNVASLPADAGVNQTRHCSLEKYSAVLQFLDFPALCDSKYF